MVQRSGSEDGLDRSVELSILFERQTPHQHCAGVDFLVCRFQVELREEIHRLYGHLTVKGEDKAKLSSCRQWTKTNPKLPTPCFPAAVS